MKPKLKIGFVDYYDPIDVFFKEVLSTEFDLISDNISPDVLFFCDETFGVENRRFDNGTDTVKVFFTGENRRPENYSCHMGISFDHTFSPNHYRLPLYVVENWVLKRSDIKRPVVVVPKSGFCSFVASNPGCKERNDIFHKLNKYKKVDSAGPLFNNTGYILPRNGIEAQKSKLEFLSTRKFNICYENGSYPGYVTEKILHAFWANTIPIYWGSPTVNLDFNPEAFINRHDFESDDGMLEFIRFVDEDSYTYDYIRRQPIYNQYNIATNLNTFVRWFAAHPLIKMKTRL